jgi:hypothetical protein
LPSQPALGIELCDLLAIRTQQPDYYVDPALIHHQLHILTGVERKLIRMRLAASQLSLNRFVTFEPLNLLVVLPRLVLEWRFWNDGKDGWRPDEEYETKMKRQ